MTKRQANTPQQCGHSSLQRYKERRSTSPTSILRFKKRTCTRGEMHSLASREGNGSNSTSLQTHTNWTISLSRRGSWKIQPSTSCSGRSASERMAGPRNRSAHVNRHGQATVRHECTATSVVGRIRIEWHGRLCRSEKEADCEDRRV